MDRRIDSNLIHSIIESLPNGLMVTDASAVVTLINPALIRHLQLPETTTAGHPVQAYLDDTGLQQRIVAMSSGRHDHTADVLSYEFTVADGKYLLADGRPLWDAQRRCCGAVVNVVDISTMKVLDRLKTEFVAKVSHELRSPLSTIHEQLAMVLNHLVGHLSPPHAHMLSRAKEKTQGLITLIGDLLDLSRIESGVVCQTPKPVAVEELLANIIGFLHTKALQKHQDLKMEQGQASLPTINADPLALESIFTNLITNAIHYTPDGGQITVGLDHQDQWLRIQVADTGIGIAPEQQKKIFDRFYRVKTDQTRDIPGTGLGLPIVKGLVGSLGGDICLNSRIGLGSTFTIRLPVLRPAETALPNGGINR